MFHGTSTVIMVVIDGAYKPTPNGDHPFDILDTHPGQ